MAPRPDLDEVAAAFHQLADAASPRSPLYAHLATQAAGDPEVMELLGAAPPEQRLPVLLMAAVHDVVLTGGAPELAAYYRSATPEARPVEEAYEAFRDTCLENADVIRETLATRSTQTNEVGRCAMFLPAVGLLAAEVGALSLLDVGASAGLNLLLDRYEYLYDPAGTVGGPSTVTLKCATRGPLPVPATMPAIAERIGIDMNPIDVRDAAGTRWLEACVWPDQLDRFELLRNAVGIARSNPPDVRRGDAVDDLPATLAVLQQGHPVVLTSWVLSYLPASRRQTFIAHLDRAGAERDLSWVVVEAPSSVPELPIGSDPQEQRTAVAVVRWRDGQRQVERLGLAHPHGFWFHWDR